MAADDEAPRAEDPRAVLITGAYGSGKSSVAAEIADVLETQDVPYAFIDLDFLGWANSPRRDSHKDHTMLLANLACSRDTFVAEEIRYFILAGYVDTPEFLEALRSTLGMPLRVVRLDVPIDEIQRRLASDVTSGRKDDLRGARLQIAERRGVGLEDRSMQNEGPVRELAQEVVRWLGWP